MTPIESSNQIAVKCPIEQLPKVAEVLAGLRNQQNMLVDIHARFLRVESDLVDELGVNWAGLSGRTVSGLAGSSSGILNPAGKTNDLRFRGPLDTANATSYDTSFLGGSPFRIDPTGGKPAQVSDAASVLQFSYLSDWQASMILKAVHMSRKGSIVHAPHLKCFNTQRAYMMLIREKAYIKDVATLVSSGTGGAAGLDPEIGTIREGTSFEVRPVVSADRKFITLEMKPTQAEIVATREINVQSAIQGNSTAPPLNIQAPTLELSQIRTTVSIPTTPRSAGRLTAYATTQAYNGLPVLKIPVLNFSSKGHRHQGAQSLMIMVRAQIVDNLEEEEKVRPPALIRSLPSVMPLAVDPPGACPRAMMRRWNRDPSGRRGG